MREYTQQMDPRYKIPNCRLLKDDPWQPITFHDVPFDFNSLLYLWKVKALHQCRSTLNMEGGS